MKKIKVQFLLLVFYFLIMMAEEIAWYLGPYPHLNTTCAIVWSFWLNVHRSYSQGDVDWWPDDQQLNFNRKNGTFSFFIFSSLIQIYHIIFSNYNFCHIISSESSIIYYWAFGQWLNISFASTCILTSSPNWAMGQ